MFGVTAMEIDQKEPHLLVTSESKRIRLWDLRVPLTKAGKLKSCVDISDAVAAKQNLRTTTCPAEAKNDFINGACKMVLQSSDRRLVSQFTNSKGLHTFDLRKGVK